MPTAVFNACADCGSEHIGPPCGMTFAQRLRTVTVSQQNWETADKKNYYDPDPVREMFGEDAQERMMEETKGIGPVTQGADGTLFKSGASGEAVPLTAGETETLLSRDREEA